jgi:transposase
MDLKDASRDELIAIILSQREVIARLEQVVRQQQRQQRHLERTLQRLTERLGEQLVAPEDEEPPAASPGGGPAGMPGLKRSPAPERPARECRRRGRGYARRRQPPTREVRHALEQCPDCQTRLSGGTVVHRRQVLEVPLVPVEVVEHVYLARRCPCCQRAVRPAVELSGVVVGQSRLGVRLVGLIATLREVGRLPLRTIQALLGDLYGLELSEGGLVGALRQVERRGAGFVETIQTAIRGSPVVHADESGWREDGRNGYVWTFSTPTERYCVRRGRGKVVVDEVLGEDFSGVLVSDFYAAYDHYPGLKQRCWAHLLREIKDLESQHARDPTLRGWAAAVRDVYRRATAACPLPRYRHQQQRAYEQELQALGQPYRQLESAPQAGLCRRIEKYLTELFVFVADPQVPATNNAAERSLRPLVVARKVSGGSRSAAGSTIKMVLASLVGTWRARSLNPFTECCRLLSTAQV